MAWHLQVVATLNAMVTLLTLVVGVVAFIHCATQRADAFPALGTLQKPAWLAIIGAATVMSLLGRGFLLFNLIALGASALYLLDVRPGLRGITGGQGSW
jgi:hypothetical protein